MPDRKISAETPLSAPQDLSKMRVPLFHQDGTPNDAVMTLEQVLLSPRAIDINTGSIASSAIGLRIQQTWTGTGTYDAPLMVNVTDSGPANAGSGLLDLQLGGSSQLFVRRDGMVAIGGVVFLFKSGNFNFYYGGADGTVIGAGSPSVGIINIDVLLARDNADILAQRRSGNPQRSRLYNTHNGANGEYLESGFVSNVARLYSVQTGTGTLRPLSIGVGSFEAIGVSSTGVVSIPNVKRGAFTITDGTSVDITPSSGGFQTWTIAADRTPVAPTNFANGEELTLHLARSGSFNVTWTSVPVTWVDGLIPTIPASGYAIIKLWKANGTIYGTKVGDVA